MEITFKVPGNINDVVYIINKDKIVEVVILSIHVNHDSKKCNIEMMVKFFDGRTTLKDVNNLFESREALIESL